MVGFRKRPGHERISQIGAALDASAALRLPIDLGHVFKVNEVAEAQRGQVQPGLLTVVRCLDGDAHLRVVRRPTAGVVLPLPQPALTRRCVWVVKTTSNRSKGSWSIDKKAVRQRNLALLLALRSYLQEELFNFNFSIVVFNHDA